MPDGLPRRRFLQASVVGAASAIAGCGQILPGGSAPGSSPVETDSAGNPVTYGLVLRNDSEWTPDSVHIRIGEAFGEKTVFDETVPMPETDEQESWSDVIRKDTEDGELVEFVISATIVNNGNEANTANYWITPGSDSAPRVGNVVVRMARRDGDLRLLIGPEE